MYTRYSIYYINSLLYYIFFFINIIYNNYYYMSIYSPLISFIYYLTCLNLNSFHYFILCICPRLYSHIKIKIKFLSLQYLIKNLLNTRYKGLLLYYYPLSLLNN